MHQHASPFTVAGMPSSTSSHHLHHSQHQPAWGGNSFQPGASTFGESLGGGPSRSLYQSGYLMGAKNTDPNSQSSSHARIDGDPPIVQTKAKMNHVLSRSSTDSFGMDSMFDSKRGSPRGHMAQDEDAPPMRSINDMEEDMFGTDSSFGRRKSQLPADSPFLRRFNSKPSTPLNQSRHQGSPSSVNNSSQPTLFVIVFGYPLEKYSATVEFFKSLSSSAFGHGQQNPEDAGCTEVEANAEVMNCFRIGYRNPADAARAIRKNGEVIGGSWMIGVKWADPTLAESVLGASLMSSPSSSAFNSPEPMDLDSSPAQGSSSHFRPPAPPTLSTSTSQQGMDSDRMAGALVTVGTPIKLAPSSSAFRVGGPGARVGTPAGVGGNAVGAGAAAAGTPAGTPGQASPNKSMLGQVSDLIFGW